ncbi:unnamed protein product [Amoebophrya sp. A120]|nr:unnamed protein product [Amoebophrya sp. A120]|eukprot:GSA120T00019476001.1
MEVERGMDTLHHVRDGVVGQDLGTSANAGYVLPLFGTSPHLVWYSDPNITDIGWRVEYKMRTAPTTSPPLSPTTSPPPSPAPIVTSTDEGDSSDDGTTILIIVAACIGGFCVLAGVAFGVRTVMMYHRPETYIGAAARPSQVVTIDLSRPPSAANVVPVPGLAESWKSSPGGAASSKKFVISRRALEEEMRGMREPALPLPEEAELSGRRSGQRSSGAFYNVSVSGPALQGEADHEEAAVSRAEGEAFWEEEAGEDDWPGEMVGPAALGQGTSGRKKKSKKSSKFSSFPREDHAMAKPQSERHARGDHYDRFAEHAATICKHDDWGDEDSFWPEQDNWDENYYAHTKASRGSRLASGRSSGGQKMAARGGDKHLREGRANRL